MAIYFGKAKLAIIGKDGGIEGVADISEFSFTPDDEAPNTAMSAPPVSVHCEIETTPQERRNLLVWWLMLSALANAHRILD